MKKPSLLFITHRIPYPPHKGEKLRAYHMIKGLAAEYDIFLGTLIDDPDDWQHRHALDEFCVETFMADARGKTRSRAALSALLKNESVTASYFRDQSLLDWVADVSAKTSFDAALLYSSGVGGYLDAMSKPPARFIMDFVDADSEKWAALAKTANPAMRQVYLRESAKVLKLEHDLALRADASVFVTDAECATFERVTGFKGALPIGNGVELEYWQEAQSLPSLYPEMTRPRAIFTGAMGYEPNVAAVKLFAEHTMPQLEAWGTPIHFVIAGSNPAPAVQALGKRDDITVTGRVPDMRPYLGHSDFSIAPLTIARGVQNKVLEAMAAGIPCISSAPALEGISARDGEHVIVAHADAANGMISDAACGAAFAQAIRDALADPERTQKIAATGQRMVRDQYSWSARVSEFSDLIRGQMELRKAS